MTTFESHIREFMWKIEEELKQTKIKIKNSNSYEERHVCVNWPDALGDLSEACITAITHNIIFHNKINKN